MKRISRGQFKLVIFTFLAIAMTVPVALVRSEPLILDFDRPASEQARTSVETSPPSPRVQTGHSDTRSRVMPDMRDTGPEDFEEEDPVAKSDRDESDTEDRASWQAIFPDDRLEPTREWMSPPEPEETPDKTNRSVVGWSNASISSFQQQQRIPPARLAIPSLSIDARIDPVGVQSDGAMEIPDDRDTVGWYRHGSAPDDPGSTVIAGHLDDAFGRSVFFDLQMIEIGATIQVTLEDGSERSYRVYEKVAYPSDNLPSNEIFSRDGDPVLALLTCGGQWDRESGRYTETVVIYAEPVGEG